MTAARVDGNQSAIVAALRAVGCSVHSLATVGDGCPDLLVGKGGQTYLIECKQPGKRLSPIQKAWHAAWRGKAHIAYSVDQALMIVGARVT